jgi:hypothetical protein
MIDDCPDFVFVAQVPGSLLGSINTAVLAARTTKINSKTGKSPAEVILYAYVHQIKYAVQEFGHAGILLEVVYHFFIGAALGFIFIYTTGV